jgi:hypothetical protein
MAEYPKDCGASETVDICRIGNTTFCQQDVRIDCTAFSPVNCMPVSQKPAFFASGAGMYPYTLHT